MTTARVEIRDLNATLQTAGFYYLTLSTSKETKKTATNSTRSLNPHWGGLYEFTGTSPLNVEVRLFSMSDSGSAGKVDLVGQQMLSFSDVYLKEVNETLRAQDGSELAFQIHASVNVTLSQAIVTFDSPTLPPPLPCLFGRDQK